MARAKRTDRAEARRQYRQYLAQQEEARASADAASADAEATAPDKPQPAAGRGAQQPQPPRPPQAGGRLGIVAAARAATRRPTYIEDVRNIGWLIFRTNAIWPVAAVCVISALISIPRIHSNADLSTDPILSIIFQFVLWPLPLLPPMLAGFLAPRATWLAGLLGALISVLTLMFVLAVTPITVVASSPAASPSPAAASPFASPAAQATTPAPDVSASPSSGSSPTPAQNVFEKVDLGSAAISWLPGAVAFGALIGAGAGWYKRFLESMSPRQNQTRSQQKKPVRKPPAGRK